MKKFIFLPLILLLFLPGSSLADEFLKAPVIDGGQTIDKSDSRLEIKTTMSHDEVLSFYKEVLKDEENIKFRDWPDATYIEDDGNRPWHSITISKVESNATVLIVKDNWTWIIGTLILRYVAVFVVLMVLFVGMTFSGKIISTLVKKAEAKKAAS